MKESLPQHFLYEMDANKLITPTIIILRKVIFRMDFYYCFILCLRYKKISKGTMASRGAILDNPALEYFYEINIQECILGQISFVVKMLVKKKYSVFFFLYFTSSHALNLLISNRVFVFCWHLYKNVSHEWIKRGKTLK